MSVAKYRLWLIVTTGVLLAATILVFSIWGKALEGHARLIGLVPALPLYFLWVNWLRSRSGIRQVKRSPHKFPRDPPGND